MVGPLLRSLCSAASRKSIYSSSANYRKASVLSPATAFTRQFSASTDAATPPSTTKAFGTAVDPSNLRNVAVIVHVDHGKTMLMDRLLRHCGADIPHERAMDSINLEREVNVASPSPPR